MRAKAALDKHNILFQSGLNEDLAATAIWGTQQAELRGEASTTACSACGTARGRRRSHRRRVPPCQLRRLIKHGGVLA